MSSFLQVKADLCGEDVGPHPDHQPKSDLQEGHGPGRNNVTWSTKRVMKKETGFSSCVGLRRSSDNGVVSQSFLFIVRYFFFLFFFFFFLFSF